MLLNCFPLSMKYRNDSCLNLKGYSFIGFQSCIPRVTFYHYFSLVHKSSWLFQPCQGWNDQNCWKKKKKKRATTTTIPLIKTVVLKYFFFEISITFPRCCLYNKILLQMLLSKQHFFNIRIFSPCPTPLSHRHFCLVFRLLKFLISQKVLLDKAGNKYFVLHNKGN